jgi:hypothetical protein
VLKGLTNSILLDERKANKKYLYTYSAYKTGSYEWGMVIYDLTWCFSA